MCAPVWLLRSTPKMISDLEMSLRSRTKCPLHTPVNHNFRLATPPRNFFHATDKLQTPYSPRKRVEKLLSRPTSSSPRTQDSPRSVSLTNSDAPISVPLHATDSEKEALLLGRIHTHRLRSAEVNRRQATCVGDQSRIPHPPHLPAEITRSVKAARPATGASLRTLSSRSCRTAHPSSARSTALEGTSPMPLMKLEDIDDGRDDPDSDEDIVRSPSSEEPVTIKKKAAVTCEEKLTEFGQLLLRAQEQEALEAASGGGQGVRAQVVSKDYHLIRMLFQIELMDNTKANKAIRQLGEEIIVKRLALLRRRFGGKRLNHDEFHYALEILVGKNKVTRSESDTFFDMFDTNRSGGIDEAEFLSGIKMTLHDQKRSLASYCHRMMDVRTSVGTVITMMEISLLLHAVAEVAATQYPGCLDDVRSVIDELEPQAHHSQVPLVFFRAAVGDTKVLATVLREMTADAALPPVPSPIPSPTPSTVFDSIEQSTTEQSKRKGSATGSSFRKSPPDQKKEHGETLPSSLSQLPTLTPADASLNASFLKSPRISEPALDVTSRRFRADESIRADQFDSDTHPPEHHNPVWYLRNGVVWRSSDLTGPMTMT